MTRPPLIRCRLSFALLQSAIRCMRGSRSTAGRPAYHNHPDHSEVVLSETALTYHLSCYSLRNYMYTHVFFHVTFVYHGLHLATVCIYPLPIFGRPLYAFFLTGKGLIGVYVRTCAKYARADTLPTHHAYEITCG